MTVALDDWGVVAEATKPERLKVEAGSDADALALLYQEAKDIEAKIHELTGYVKGEPPASGRLLDQANKAFIAACKEKGEVLTSIEFGPLQYVYQKRYTPLRSEKTVAQTEKAHGEKFEERFNKVWSLEIPIDQVDEELKAMLKKRGMKPTCVLKPTDAYHLARIMDGVEGPKNVAYLQITKEE